jgi:hypothetical protein
MVEWRQGLGPATASRVDNYSVSLQFSPTALEPWWLTCVYGLVIQIHLYMYKGRLRT